MILNLEDMPDDPLQALIWLGGVNEAVRAELDDAYATAYYEARLTGRFPEALEHGAWPRKRAVAATRRINESLGRQVRWGDGY